MPELEEVSLAIGRLQGTVEGVAANQLAHQTRDDAQHAVTQELINTLTKHVDRENAELNKRIEHVEHYVETQKRVLKWAGATIGLIVLFLSGTWDYWIRKL